jgi:hypothetical protein
MAAEISTGNDNALAYFCNKGGLNNQKLALFGLFLKAFHEGPRRIVLPNLLLFDQVSFNHRPVPFDQGMRRGTLRDFAARHGIEILDLPPQGDEGGWDYFHYGNNHIPRAALLNELGQDNFTCDFFRSLQPAIQGSDLLPRVTDAAFGRKGIRLAVQMRVEKDWAHHTAVRLKPVVGETEQNAPSFIDILAKIKHTLPEVASSIYVICDEAALPVPKDEIREIAKREFDVDLVWKSDFLTVEELESLSLLDLSTLDFEMAITADTFVGLTRSTFSNMASFEKYARTRKPLERHYIYNTSGPGLALRKDNGVFSVPELASAADPWDSAHNFHLAQIFEASGERHRALEHYAARAASGGPDQEEKFLSLYRAARIKADLGFSATDVVDTYIRAADALPSRAEAAYGASRHCRVHKMFGEGYEIAARAIELPLPMDGKFVEPWIYEWALLDEYAVNAYWSGHYLECLNACLKILRLNKFPENQRDRIATNARLSLDNLLKQADRGS